MDSQVDGERGAENAEMDLLDLLMADEQRHHAPRRPSSGHAWPLSFQQQRLFFLQRFEPDSTAYNICRGFRLHGLLDADALEQAFRIVMQRHEVLRSRFVERNGEPCQIVADEMEFAFDRTAASIDSGDTASHIRALLAREAQHVFDLGNGPLVRVVLSELARDEHLLILNVHHIVSDDLSNSIWIRELVHTYRRLRAGETLADAPLSWQYADYAKQQREAFEQGDAQDDLAYWREYLGDASGSVVFPRDANADVNTRGVLTGVIDGERFRRGGAFCARNGCSPFTLFFAAWQLSVSAWAGQAPFQIGVPHAGRADSRVEDQIGFFVDTHVYRVQADPSLSLLQFVQALHAQSVQALDHGQVPFDLLVRELDVVRTPDRHPVFQIVFDFKTGGREQFELPGLRMAEVEHEGGRAKFDMTLSVELTDSHAQYQLEFDPRWVSGETAKRVFDGYARVLATIVDRPDERVGALPLVDDVERSALLALARDDERYAETRAVHEVIASQALRFPDAVAVVYGEQRVSYGELEERANRLAHRLIKLGVGPEVRVGIAVERSVEMVVGLLATLKAGGAYVPLDPEYPRERLAYMLEDSGITLLLTQSWIVNTLPVSANVRVVELDTQDVSTESAEAPHVQVQGENLAYVIYTSGSTGKPKGAANRHSALTNRLVWMQSAYALNESDVVLQKTPFSFDVSVWEFFWPLMYGAKLAVAEPGAHRDPQKLVELIKRHDVTTLHFVPSMLQAFVAHQNAGTCCGLKRIVCSGEALPAELSNRTLQLLPEVGLYNLYGPTEAAIDVTHWTCMQGEPLVPIGRPIGNVQTYVLDAALNLVPKGVAGELYLGGAGLARGYLNRAGLTAERFIASPFDANGGRLYRTGDLVRWRDDGALEYLGRIDHQVKIRGFRIELGEIEAQLAAQLHVREAVVTAQEGPGGARLIAYVTSATNGHTLDPQALREALSAKLPDYMVPAVILQLDALPLSPNGKVDRKALPQPDHAATQYEAPQTGTEQTLASIWQQVLKTDRIGRHDNFFELGGDSILSLKVVARASQAGIALTPRQLFEAQTVAALAQLTGNDTAITSEATSIPLTAREHGTHIPLSYAQQRLWFLWKLQPQSTAYHITGGMRLHGDLDVDALRASFDAVVARQGSLRTTFTEDADGTAQQVLHESLACEYRFEDLGAHADREAEAAAWADVLGSRAFDLETGPLLRIGVMRLSAREHVLVVVMHHIISDGGSVDVLLREFVANYRARVTGATGNEDSLPALQIQYVDYAVWQRQWLEAGEQERQLSYWREQLGGEQPVLALPVDHPRRALAGYSAASYVLQLPAELGAQVRGFAQQRGATPFMVLLGAFQALLHRYTGQQDIRVGVPVANRERMEVEPLIGFFVNMQVLRAQIDGETELSALLAQVKQAALGAQAHRDLPFDVLVEALQPERSLSHTPLFQVVLNHQKEDYGMLAQLPGLSVEGFGAQGRAAQFELTLNTVEAADGTLSGSLAYARELFDASTMERFGAHFVTMLAALVRTPQRSVSEVALVDGEERAALLKLGRGAKAEGNLFTPVHERISEQSRKQPDAVAVVFGEQRISYSELEQQANRLAHRLIKLGVGPEVRVGIAVERSVEMVVGLLSILKAGGAYVPLDPEYPAERLTYMLEDSGVTLLLTQSRIGRTLPVAENVRVVEIDTEEVAGESTEAPHVMVKSDNLAYVIYTSGSTGRPKGVMVRHGGLSNFLSSTSSQPGLQHNDTLLAVTSLSFDIAGLELYLPLLVGAKVVVASSAVTRDGAALAALLDSSGATVMQATPSGWHMLLEGGWQGRALKGLCGGEALAPDLAARLIARGVALWNMYGPTETTIWSSAGRVQQTPVLGEPLSETGLFVLDAQLGLCPLGVPGELYIGGEGLARGYLKRSALTAERFVPDPFSSHGDRLYRTGDLVRWRPDGALEYLGRIDHQVKVRGFRIELGEIEVQLIAQAGVREAVATAYEGPGGTRLVGYVTAVAGATLDAHALRTRLAQALPDYMVPGAIVVLDALPLTLNGKVDRRALPQPDYRATEYEAPEGEVERALASVWQEVLGVERVGRHDNFFELGGDSILSLKVTARAVQAGVAVTPRQLFEAQTVAGLATALLTALTLEANGQSTVPPLVPVTRTAPLPLSFAQQRLWFLWNLQPESSAYHIAGGIRLTGSLDIDALRAAMDAVVLRHEPLRTTFSATEDGMARQVIHDGALWDYRFCDLLERRDAETAARQWADAFAREVFDLETGPLLRVGLIRLADREHVLLVSMHHIVSDGWSVNVLLDELVGGYRANVTGEAQPLPALHVQYADYAVWQRRWLEGGEQERQLAYWREQLGTEQPVLALPVDHPRQTLGVYRGASLPLTLSRELGERIRQTARRANATPFMVLLAGFQALLFRYTGQRDIRVGVPVANRERAEVAGLIGVFVNTQVLAARIDERLPLRELLTRTQKAVTGAQAHQDLPFDVLVDALQPERSLSHTPLFQVMLNHQRGDDGVLDSLPGLEVGAYGAAEETAKFELTLNTRERDDGTFDGSFMYASELFNPSTIETMARHYVTMLEALVQTPEHQVGDVRLVEAAERAVLLAWGRSDERYVETRAVHEVIAERARRFPDVVAVVYGEQRVSYGELEERANRLAHRLIKLGVGPEVRVGIAVERSVEMVVGLLAILKAGGAYVPLDPEYPRERLAYMLEDSGITLLLTQSWIVKTLPVAANVRVVELDTEDVSTESAEAPDVTVQGDNLAYVIYTSGSTGKPKGVAVAHRALAMHCTAINRRYGIVAADRLLQFASISFDAAQEQWLIPLQVGASLILRDGDVWSTERLTAEIRAHAITILYLPPAYMDAFAASVAPGDVSLRMCIAGGEAWSAKGLERVRSALRPQRIFNAYGPAETVITPTVWSADIVASGESKSATDSAYVPVGSPVGERAAYVLDAALNLVPRGVVGELYLGGTGLARGYLNRAALTAERFVPDPFDANGARLYRTGDLVRWRDDGALEYLGRIDHQVKIRGFRIELGEIEAQLAAQPRVREAVVTAQEGSHGARLIAYVTAGHGSEALDTAALRKEIGRHLPDYMVPGVVIQLDSLPLSPNGKVDRRALPQPDYRATEYEAPEGEVERALASVWQDVLGVERVGRHDNFFELGGDSILSLKVTARAVQAGVAVTPRQLFEAQTVAGLATALLTALTLEANGQSTVPPLVPVTRAAPLPLSFAQQRLWFLWNLQPESSAYHIAGGIRLTGSLDIDALRAAMDAVVLRHEPLRTTFSATEDGMARQVIHDGALWDYRFCDLLERRDAETAARQWADAFAREVFDLETGPLLRVGLIRLADREHVLLVSMHHIVSDGWSVNVLLDELVGGYRANVTGEAQPLPALHVQYADYAVWQRRWLEGGEQERQLAYWREQLGTEQPVLALPVDHPRQTLGVYRGASLPLTLSRELGERIRQTARRANATPFMVLLAGFQALLFRYTGQRDIRVGVPVANRERAEVAGLIGVFVNTQVLAARIDERLPLRELLTRTQKAVTGAQAHQDLPFDVLVDALQPERSLSHTPLFQVMLNHQRGDDGVLDSLPGLEVGAYGAAEETAKFELTLNTRERDDGTFDGSFMYASELFNPSTIETMARHYVTMLEALVQTPEHQVGDVRLVEAAERAVLLAWGRSDERYVETRAVHEVIAARARRFPDVVAVVYGEQRVSYGELEERANRLAHRLIKLGVGPEVRVGIAVERSVEMVVGLLAILKAGGAYVPLDPEYPRERLAYMLEDSGITLLLTQSWIVDTLPVAANVRVVELDTEDVSTESAEATHVQVQGENLAYVIYTSGSTGKPKGAANRHSALTNRLVWMQSAYALNESDVVLQKTPFSFDVSVWEFFWPLMYGAKLAVAEPGAHRDPQKLVELIHRHDVTTLHFVPSMLQAFVAHQNAGTCCGLKRIVCSGEALPAELSNRTLKLLPEVGLYNLYGPTEAAIDVTHWTCTQGEPLVPIGRPIGNVQTHVLDAALNLVPKGVAGELYLGGAGLARGYLNRAGLTAERFVASPFDANGARLYRTGDLVRWRDDGALEYLGRIDHQVKIRGFRIELGEIEAQLAAQLHVREAVVTAQEGPGGARLIAYVTSATNGHTLDPQALREALSAQLPDYMVPAVVMQLDALPLSPNGKVDRKALPQPDHATTQYEAPQTGTEQTLASIWQQVLKTGRIGRHDNFFELGGDSILSLQIVARARQTGWKITSRQLFQHPTIGALARVASTGTQRETRVEIHEALPLTPIQNEFFVRYPQGESHWNQSVLLRVLRPLDDGLLQRSIDAIIARHDSLRLRFLRDAGSAIDGASQWQQIVLPDTGRFDIDSIDLSNETDLPSAIHREGTRLQRSLDIEHGPLMRVANLHTATHGWLLIVIHHLAVDGVSWRILLDDLQHAYERLEQGQKTDLPASTPWSAWVRAQADYAQSDAVRSEAAWWRNALAHAQRPALASGIDTHAATVETCSQAFDADLTRTLLQDAHHAYRTHAGDLLLTAFAQTLSTWLATPGVLIDLEGHGREPFSDAIDLSRSIGWFTTRYPLWLAASDDARGAITHVKEQHRAVPAKGLHWGMLLASRELARGEFASPLFAFNYLGQFDQSLERDGRFSFADESGGQAISTARLPDYAIDVNALVSDGKLSVNWRYRTDMIDVSTANRIAAIFDVRLRALVAHCSGAAAGATASDFPLAGIDGERLDQLALALGDVQDIYPATPLQNGMLFHSLKQPGQGFYINQRRFTVGGKLDVDALRGAWDTLVARHDVLRTAFRWKHDVLPLQIVYRKVTLPFVESDWKHLSHTDYEARLAEWRTQDIAADFDLERAPLLRVALFHRHDGQHDLVWTEHHALTDGWSTAQLFGELWHCYHARASGQAEQLAAPLQYREHVAWLQTRDDPAPWWLERIATIGDPALITESQPRRAAGGDHEGVQAGVIECTLDAKRQAALNAATQRLRVTLSTLVQGAWAMLLSRYGNRAQIAFGVTVSGRENDLAGADRMVGLFINSLPMWVNVPGHERLHAWLNGLQAYGSELRERSFTPLADVQRWSGRSGDALFDSLVVVENYAVDQDIRNRGIGLSLTDTSVAERTHYPLVLAVLPGESIALRFKFDPARLDAFIVEQLHRHYIEILDQVCTLDNPHLGEIVLNGARRREPARCDHAFDPVARRIGEQARVSPHAPALHCEGQRLSYAELDGWANRLARRLNRLGVRADERVGVCMQRAPGLVAALLGVMKSGGAFVPLDPEYPEDRLAYMIEDAGVKRVLVDDLTSAGLGTLLEGLETLRVDAVDDESPEPFDRPVHPDQLAYVIYTSGSTGRPKGVGISQRSLSLHLDDFLQTYGITSNDKQLQSSTVNFDVALHEMLPALMRGGQIEMRGPQLWDLETTSRHLADEHVTFSRIPTAYWQQWLRDPPAAARLAHLRQITVGGEGLPGDALRQWREGPLGHIRLDNLYGPTETTVACMYRETTADDVNQPVVSIGRPYPSRSVYVLDGNGNEAPVGALGELCIGGETLARGYLNRAAQTAEKFIPDPFRTDGGRLYRTGDLCRRREDGTIDFLGRMDQQVKLRGFRIELGEIESALRQVEGVREAAVELRGDGDAKRLVGYVAGTAGEAEVRRGIEGVLPGYMVPSAFVMLERLPVMPNGKVDRKALPEPVAASQSYEAPQGEVEEALARIWCEVLGVERIGRFDNFFEIGGHSLLAMRLVSRVNAELQVDVSIESLFISETFEGFAAQVSSLPTRDAVSDRLDSLESFLDTLEGSSTRG